MLNLSTEEEKKCTFPLGTHTSLIFHTPSELYTFPGHLLRRRRQTSLELVLVAPSHPPETQESIRRRRHHCSTACTLRAKWGCPWAGVCVQGAPRVPRAGSDLQPAQHNITAIHGGAAATKTHMDGVYTFERLPRQLSTRHLNKSKEKN